MASQEVSRFLQDISEQPESLRSLVRYYRGEGRVLLDKWRELVRTHKRIVFVGIGTAEFVAESIIPELSRCDIDASTVDAGEWLHYGRRTDALPVLVSLSGENAETRLLAQQMGSSTRLVAITNNTSSTLARHATLVLPVLADEDASIWTKTYVNTLAVLQLMAKTIHDDEALETVLDRLQKLSIEMLDYDSDAVTRAGSLLNEENHVHFIARGPSMVAAWQSALTFMAGARMHSGAFTGGIFRHGPLELVDSSYRAVIFLPAGETFDRLFRLARELNTLGAGVVAITDQPIERERFPVLRVPDYGESLFCISAASAHDLLLEEIARRRGIDVGEFRNMQKISTQH